MKFTTKLFAILMGFCLIQASLAAPTKPMTPSQLKQFMQQAIIYALENKDPNLDYSKYISKNYIQHIDGKTFNFDQYVEHMNAIKKQTKSLSVKFEGAVAEGNEVSIAEVVTATKNNGEIMQIKVIGIFTIENNKVILGNEITRLIAGNEQDKDFGSLSK